MAVYVEPLRNHGWKLGPSCHLVGDTLAELHAFARALGLRRSWFQDKRTPHYDLTAGKRALAVSRGAVELTFAEAVAKWRTVEGNKNPPWPRISVDGAT